MVGQTHLLSTMAASYSCRHYDRPTGRSLLLFLDASSSSRHLFLPNTRPRHSRRSRPIQSCSSQWRTLHIARGQRRRRCQ